VNGIRIVTSAVADCHVGMSLPFILQRQLPDLGVQRGEVHRFWRGARAKDLGCALKQPPLPVGDLVRMHLELFAQFSHGAVLSQGGHGHSGLERRIVRAPGAPRRCFLLDHKKPLFVRPLSVRLYTRSFHL